MNNDAATFTMTLCSSDRQKALELARESFEWYPAKGRGSSRPSPTGWQR